MKLASSFALAVAFLPTFARAADAPDLKGLRIGMTEGEVITAFPAAKCFWPKSTVFNDRVCVDSKNSIAGHPARLMVSFMGERVMRVDFLFSQQHGLDVAAGLNQKFGPAATQMVFGSPGTSRMSRQYVCPLGFNGSRRALTQCSPWSVLRKRPARATAKTVPGRQRPTITPCISTVSSFR